MDMDDPTAVITPIETPGPVESPHDHASAQGQNGAAATTTASSSPMSDGLPDDQGERQASIASSQQSRSNDTGTSTSNGQSIAGTSTNSKDKDKDRERATVPSACVQCRSKHLKCDGLSPCTRCSSNEFECIYVRSRRGFKGPRRNGTPGKAVPVSGSVGERCPLVHPGARATPNIPTGLVTPPDHRLMTLPRPGELPLFDIGQEVVAFDPKAQPTGLDFHERCLEAFFYHFWPAHPFVLPRNQYFALRKEKPLDHLEAAMRYVGSFYVPHAPTVALGLEAERTAYHADCPKDGFQVQAMLILTIGLDGFTHQEKALSILIDAQNLAMDIGMNKREFAYLNANGSDLLEESWRRTWWELYVIDGMIAGVHQKSNFRMKDIPSTTALPCEEREYVSGQIPPPHTLEDFDDDSFDGRDFLYSSFTYRIAAMRNLGRVLSSRAVVMPDGPIVDRVDAYLVNWRLHLPEAKKDFINAEGQLDEMLFQAHMITEATTILLHRELSELDSSVARNVTSCAPHKPIAAGPTYNIHAAKTIQAAQDVSKLIQLPVPLVKHSHFFTCVVTLASIVHLSCWSVLMPLIHDEDLKQQLRLNTGALKTLRQVWPAAGKAFGEVKGVAQEIYAGKKQAAELGYWAELSDEEIMRSMIDDQTIMEELQLLN